VNGTQPTGFDGLAGTRADAGDASLPYLRPVAAGTMMIVDGSGAQPRVLMGRRHEKLAFHPGIYVFPGGRVEASDRRMNVAGALDEHVERRLLCGVKKPSPQRARAQALAAIRETFEETGLLIGSRDYGAPENPPEGAWSLYAAQWLFPELDRLHLIARAITPPGRNRRFDTAFFAVDAQDVADRVEDMSGPERELVELVWLPIEKAGQLDMLPVTRTALFELAARIEAGMRPYLPVPLYTCPRGIWRRELL